VLAVAKIEVDAKLFERCAQDVSLSLYSQLARAAELLEYPYIDGLY